MPRFMLFVLVASFLCGCEVSSTPLPPPAQTSKSEEQKSALEEYKRRLDSARSITAMAKKIAFDESDEDTIHRLIEEVRRHPESNFSKVIAPVLDLTTYARQKFKLALEEKEGKCEDLERAINEGVEWRIDMLFTDIHLCDQQMVTWCEMYQTCEIKLSEIIYAADRDEEFIVIKLPT